MARILVIEDDERLAEVLDDCLTTSNHLVETVRNGKDGLERLLYSTYDLAILDWHLPDMTGFDICKSYRENGGQMPILFLTGNSDVDCRVGALDIGADDYLTKPFAFKELQARVNALLRRPQQIAEKVLTYKNLNLDLSSKTVSVAGRKLALAASEYALLELMMRNPGKVFSYDELMDRVFKNDEEASEEAVRQRVTRLRKKIDTDGDTSCIRTIKGLGYSFGAE